MSHISHNRLRQQLKDIDSLFRTNSPVKEVEVTYNELDINCDVHSALDNGTSRRKSVEPVRSKSRNSRCGSMSLSESFDERRESFPEYLENYSLVEDDECNNRKSSLSNILESTVISSSPRNNNKFRHRSEDRDVITSRANSAKKTSEARDWHKSTSISTSNISALQSSKKNSSIDHPSKFPDMLRSTSQNDMSSRRSSWSYLPNSARKASLPLNNKHSNLSVNSLSSLKMEPRFILNFPSAPQPMSHRQRHDSQRSDSSHSSSGVQKLSKPRKVSIDSLNSSSRRSSRKISDFGLSDDENRFRFNFQHETMLVQVSWIVRADTLLLGRC